MPLFNIKRFTNQEREAVQKAIQYIEANYKEKISADQLSQDLFIPIKKLQKGVKDSTGETVHNYLLKIRLDRAKEILSTTDVPIQNIPKTIGIMDLTHFYRAFKKYVGQSPAAYRLSQNG